MHQETLSADAPPPVYVGGLRLGGLSRREWTAMLLRDFRRRRGQDLPPRLMSSANGNVIALYHRDPSFRAQMDEMDAVDADGMPLVLASKVLSPTPLPERVATTDFFHDAAALAQRHGMRFYMLGGTTEVSRAAVAAVRQRYPRLQIAGARDGYFSSGDEERVLDDVQRAATDVLWVGMGVPKEHAFAVNHLRRLRGVTWVKTCGGLFDFLAGAYRRAPRWMQRAGLEWAYRAASEPRRLGKRYATTNLYAVYHILRSSTASHPRQSRG